MSKVNLSLRQYLSVEAELEYRGCTCILVEQLFVDGIIVR